MHVDEIKPDLMVHARGSGEMGGAKGVHVGTVDHMDGENYVKLKRSDSEDGKHHWIPIDWVEKVDEKAVYLNKNEEEFAQNLLNECPIN